MTPCELSRIALELDKISGVDWRVSTLKTGLQTERGLRFYPHEVVFYFVQRENEQTVNIAKVPDWLNPRMRLTADQLKRLNNNFMMKLTAVPMKYLN
ncbi:MAG: hypothetical protein WCK48_02005 [bacterium]